MVLTPHCACVCVYTLSLTSYTANGNTMCVECEDTEAAVRCDNCQDEFCELCFLWLHNKGKRKAHVKVELPQAKRKQQAKQEFKSIKGDPSSIPPLHKAPGTDNVTNNVQASSVDSDGSGVSTPQQSPAEVQQDPQMLKLRDAVLSDLEVCECE